MAHTEATSTKPMTIHPTIVSTEYTFIVDSFRHLAYLRPEHIISEATGQLIMCPGLISLARANYNSWVLPFIHGTGCPFGWQALVFLLFLLWEEVQPSYLIRQLLDRRV